MMEDLFERIESPLFHARLGVSSGFDSFMNALAATPEAKELLREMKTSEAVQAVSMRASIAANRPADENYENPLDTSLATYLWALDEVDDQSVDGVANYVLACPGLWWSRKFAEKLRSDPRTSADRDKVHNGGPVKPIKHPA